MANYFDKYDEVTTEQPANYFDKYDAEIKQPVPTPAPKSSLMAPVEGEGGAAFGVFRKPKTQPVVAEKSAEPKIAFEDLYKKPEYFDVVKDYMKAAGQPTYKEGTSKEEYVKDFMSQRRFADLNTVFGMVPELVQLKNAPEETKAGLALGRRLFENVESALPADKSIFAPNKGQPGIRPYWDVIKALATDPSTYAGGILGKGVAKGAAKEIAKDLAASSVKAATEKAVTKGTIVGGVTEAALGAASDVTAQRAEQQTARILGEEPEDLSLVRTGIATMFGGLFGAGTARGAMRKDIGEKANALSKALEEKKLLPTTPTAPATSVEKVLADGLRDNMDKVHDEFIKQNGERVLGVSDPINTAFDQKTKTALSQSAVRTAMKIIELDPTFQLKPGEQISTAINKVFSNVDQIDDTVLEQALTSSGLTPRQFAEANKVSVSEGARLMQQYSTVSRMWKKIANIDPAFDKKMKELYSVDNEHVGATEKFFNGVRAVERESKVWITSGIDTLVRNAIGTNINLTVKAGVDLMEGFIYSTGKALSAATTGQGMDTVKTAFSDTIKNSFSTFYYLKNNGLATEITDELLKFNPSLKENIARSLQDTGNEEISRVGRWASAFNASVDAFYRKAAFTASVEKQLRAQGMDLYKDFLAKDAGLPPAILSRAVDDALKTTLSYMPKITKDKTVEGLFESGASRVVSTIEKTPFASLAIPFPRFMSNAMALQYRYSPLGLIGAGSDFLQVPRLVKEGSMDKAELYFRQGTEKLVQGGVGVGALVAAYDYREKNQDKPWNEVEGMSGTTVDVKSIFPAAPYFAVADLLVKHNKGLSAKSADAMEAVLGMKTPAGTQNTFLDQLLAAVDSQRDMDKTAINLGKVAGDFIGRFTQPSVVKQVYDFIDLVRNEGTIARDPNVIQAEGGVEAFGEAAAKRVAGKLPVAKETLPETIPRLKEEPRIYKEGEFFNRLVGFRSTAEKSPIESEVTRLGIDPYKLYGGSSGDKIYDRAYIQEANKLVLPFVAELLIDPEYQKLPLIEKKMLFTNSVNKMAEKAREITMGNMKGSDIERVYKMRFNSLPEDTRKIINERYKARNNGVSFEEAKAYQELDQYEAGLKEFKRAVGGFIGRSLGKAFAKETEEALGRNIVKPIARAAEEATPFKSIASETPKLIDAEPIVEPVVKQTTEAFKKPFAEESYAKAEKDMIDLFGKADVEKMKKNTPKEYENLLHVYAGDVEGVAFKDLPSAPYSADALKADEAALASKVEYDKAGNPIQGGIKAEPFETAPGQEVYLQGSLNDIHSSNVKTRKEVLSVIKQQRETDFPKLLKLSRNKVEPDVIAVVQGDYRVANKKEVDLTNKEEVAKFFDMASKAQKRLDDLREKYKDTPDIELFHGNAPEAIKTIKRTGFMDPQRVDFSHSELRVGAPSFTKDINFNVNDPSYGGSNISNYVSTKMPYSEYVFKKINMSPKEYDNRDMNVLARSINGSPDTVRPISLPRSGYAETEDIFTEAEKLAIKGKSKSKLISAEKIVAPKIESAVATKEAIKEDMSLVKDYLISLGNQQPGTTDYKYLAYASYNRVRDMMKAYLGHAEAVSTKKGLGMRYQESLQYLADLSGIKNKLPKLATALESSGAKQRADNIRALWNKLDTLSDVSPVGSGARESRDITKATADITKFIPKLADGGLVARK